MGHDRPLTGSCRRYGSRTVAGEFAPETPNSAGATQVHAPFSNHATSGKEKTLKNSSLTCAMRLLESIFNRICGWVGGVSEKGKGGVGMGRGCDVKAWLGTTACAYPCMLVEADACVHKRRGARIHTYAHDKRGEASSWNKVDVWSTLWSYEVWSRLTSVGKGAVELAVLEGAGVVQGVHHVVSGVVVHQLLQPCVVVRCT